eukprot:g11055.t1 g11055   contig48:45134-45895(-)
MSITNCIHQQSLILSRDVSQTSWTTYSNKNTFAQSNLFQHSSYSCKTHQLKSTTLQSSPTHKQQQTGKALARSGELLIDVTTSLNLYGGSLSAAGASIRNSGDCLAQAAASCRFKTAAELVIDELREGADCLREGSDKLSLAVKESEVDGDTVLMGTIESMILPMGEAASWLEEAGASIMQGQKVGVVGDKLISCGESLQLLAMLVKSLDPTSAGGELSSQRMVYASEQMILAGNELKGEKKEKAKGKSWIKG